MYPNTAYDGKLSEAHTVVEFIIFVALFVYHIIHTIFM